jgi:hypothetical protein
MSMSAWIILALVILVVNEYVCIRILERCEREAGEEIKRLKREIARLSS